MMYVTKNIVGLVLLLLYNMRMVCSQQQPDIQTLMNQFRDAMAPLSCDVRDQFMKAKTDFAANSQMKFSDLEAAETKALGTNQQAVNALQAVRSAFKQMRSSIPGCFKGKSQNATAYPFIDQLTSDDLSTMTEDAMCNHASSIIPQLSQADRSSLFSCGKMDFGGGHEHAGMMNHPWGGPGAAGQGNQQQQQQMGSPPMQLPPLPGGAAPNSMPMPMANATPADMCKFHFNLMLHHMPMLPCNNNNNSNNAGSVAAQPQPAAVAANNPPMLASK